MLFTPLLPNRTRVEMDVAVEKGDVFERTLGLRGIVRDNATGKRYKVFGASCGLPNCQCDAIVREVTADV